MKVVLLAHGLDDGVGDACTGGSCYHGDALGLEEKV